MGIRTSQAELDGFESQKPDQALFFALLPSAQASRTAYALATGIQEKYSLSGHLMPMARQHVTLQKLGEFAGVIRPGLIASALAAGARIDEPAFELVFDEVMNFGSPADPAVVLAGGNSAEAIQPLWESLRQSLAREGLSSPPRLAAPHLTLIYGSSKIEREPVKQVDWQVGELVLIKSLIGHGHHEHLGRWPLRQAAA